jgi:hypothetical protein
MRSNSRKKAAARAPYSMNGGKVLKGVILPLSTTPLATDII